MRTHDELLSELMRLSKLLEASPDDAELAISYDAVLTEINMWENLNC